MKKKVILLSPTPVLRAAVLVVVVTLGIIVTTPFATAATINPDQATSLEAFYHATGGPKWTRAKEIGWVDGVPVCQTSRVSSSVVCDASGNVQTITLADNNLNGTLPSIFLTALPSLLTIDLQNNHLHGSLPVPGASLGYLELHFNDFSGSFPKGFWVPSLINVGLTGKSGNNGHVDRQLSGTISSEIANSVNLEHIYLGYNALTGAIPSVISEMKALQTWDSPVCDFTSWPDDLEKTQSLTTLILSNNDISASIPEQWCKIPWSQLDLNAMPGLTGTLPTCFASAENNGGSHWRTFSLQGTGVSIPEFPEMFFQMPNLATLELGPMTGSIPKDGWNAENFGMLGTLGLTGEGILGTIPDAMFELPSLVAISIVTTGLTGTLPSMGKLSNLHTVTILNNRQLGGEFPIDLMLNHWRYLPLNWNSNDTGLIPPPRNLNIQDNALNGTLPDFALDEVPTFLANDTSASVVLSGNNWQGYIPESFEVWITNKSLTNLLTGCRFLFHPILASQKRWIGDMPLAGFRMFPQNAYPARVSWAGSQEIYVHGEDFLEVVGEEAEALCGFCIPKHRADLSSDCGAHEQYLNYTLATWVGDGTYRCTTPSLPADGGAPFETYENVHIGILYHGPTTNRTNYTHLISLPGDATFSMYNPRPMVYSVDPPIGRREGCTLVTIKGQGFMNAPASLLAVVIGEDTWSSREGNQTIIINGSATIVDDETLTLVIPFAGSSTGGHGSVLYNAKYQLKEGVSYSVNVYPGGISSPAGITNATYVFESTCSTPLDLCDLGLGLKDEENCPTPVCRCHGTGLCKLNTTASATTGLAPAKRKYECLCLGAYRGGECDQCTSNHFGSSCSKCKCVSGHGTCDAGMDGTGHCTCFKQYVGSTCAVNWHYVAIFIPVSILLLVIAGCSFRLWKRKKNIDGGLLDGSGSNYRTNEG